MWSPRCAHAATIWCRFWSAPQNCLSNNTMLRLPTQHGTSRVCEEADRRARLLRASSVSDVCPRRSFAGALPQHNRVARPGVRDGVACPCWFCDDDCCPRCFVALSPPCCVLVCAASLASPLPSLSCRRRARASECASVSLSLSHSLCVWGWVRAWELSRCRRASSGCASHAHAGSDSSCAETDTAALAKAVARAGVATADEQDDGANDAVEGHKWVSADEELLVKASAGTARESSNCSR